LLGIYNFVFKKWFISPTVGLKYWCKSPWWSFGKTAKALNPWDNVKILF